jgi:hypothetical protein
MTSLEPNLAALLWFGVMSGVVSLGFFVLVGMFPLEIRRDLRGPGTVALVGVDVILLIALVIGDVYFGLLTLRWTSLVIVGASAFLFVPGVFNIWPEQWRDGRTGLIITLVMFGLGLSLLRYVSGIAY